VHHQKLIHKDKINHYRIYSRTKKNREFKPPSKSLAPGLGFEPSHGGDITRKSFFSVFDDHGKGARVLQFGKT